MLKPVYALLGDESFLQLQRLAELVRQAPPDVQRLEIDGERAELADVLDELRSFAMFGGGKLVVMRSADAFISRFREPLEKYLASPCTSSTLVLRLSSLPANQRIYKAIAKVGSIEKCEPPKERDLPPWIVQRARSVYKLTLTPEATGMLADLIGSDLGRLDSELAKLAIQGKDGKIGVDDIAGTIAFQREQQMWDMTNALASGNKAEAVRRWRQLLQLEPSAEFRAVTWLTMWLENVRRALTMKRKGAKGAEICQQLRIWPRELQEPFLKTAGALGESGVARALDLLAEVDHRSKSGVGDAAENVERFLLSVNVGG